MLLIRLHKDLPIQITTKYLSDYECNTYLYNNNVSNIYVNNPKCISSEMNMFFNSYGYLQYYLVLNMLGKTLEVEIVS